MLKHDIARKCKESSQLRQQREYFSKKELIRVVSLSGVPLIVPLMRASCSYEPSCRFSRVIYTKEPLEPTASYIAPANPRRYHDADVSLIFLLRMSFTFGVSFNRSLYQNFDRLLRARVRVISWSFKFRTADAAESGDEGKTWLAGTRGRKSYGVFRDNHRNRETLRSQC